MSIETNIKNSSYPEEIKSILLTALNTKFENTSKLIEHKTKVNLDLMTYKDDLLNMIWVIDLSGFVHPHGVGPNKNRFRTTSEKYINITLEFDKGNHENSAVEILLNRAIGYISDKKV